MDNVVRPAFGRRPELETKAPAAAAAAAAAAADAYRPLRVYGTAAGHLVALIRHEGGPEGASLRIVVGPVDTSAVESVAVMPATPEGEVDAEMTAMAILRTLEMIEGTAGPAA